MKVQKWHIPMAIICLISGLLLALNLRAQEENFKVTNGAQKQALVDKIQSKEKENKNLVNDINQMKKQIDSLQKAQSQGQDNLKDYQSKLEAAKKQAGLTDVKGQGVYIKVDDITDNPSPSADPNTQVVHYDYILSIVNALRSADAEAIQVNDQRIVSTSDIICGGTILLVNRIPLGPPYIIQAVGDPDKLQKAVENHSAYGGAMKDNNLPRSIEKKSSITILAYKGSFSFPYTKIYKEGEK